MNAIAPTSGWAPRTDIPGAPPLKGVLQVRPDHFFDGVVRPPAYGVELSGTCMQPEINDGDLAIVSATELPQVGDYVALFTPRRGASPLIKQLVMAPVFLVGTEALAQSDLMPLVIVSMLKPPRRLCFWSDELTAMHRVVGLVRREELATVRSSAPQLLASPTPRPTRRRKAGAA